MGAVAAVSAAVLLAALFFPQSALILIGAFIAALLAAVLLGWRNALLVAPLLVSAPLSVRFFSLTLGFRFMLLLLAGIVLFWAFADIRQRARGGPLAIGRIELFFYAGVFGLLSLAFAATSMEMFHPLGLLVVVGALGAAAMVAVGVFLQQARAAAAPKVSRALDATVSGLVLAETFAALSFFPFSPFTLAAVVIVVSWTFVRTIVLARFDGLRPREAARIAATALGALAILFLTTRWPKTG